MEEDIIEFPDIHSLFVHYDDLYFDCELGAVTVEWSRRMTLCAGLCEYRSMAGCRIKLSEPLLKFRPVSGILLSGGQDMKNTLLHEMIHAYLFLSKGNKDREDHGPNFLNKAKFINSATMADFQRPIGGYNITVYHSFHDEVDHYRTHVWSCEKCSKLISRSMNRPPSHKDCRFYRKDPSKQVQCKDPFCRWHQHEAICGGAFTKVAEPGEKSKTHKTKRQTDSSCSITKDKKRNRIDAYFSGTSSSSSSAVNSSKVEQSSVVVIDEAQMSTDHSTIAETEVVVHCPVCTSLLPEDVVTINQHLDICLLPQPPVTRRMPTQHLW